MSAEFPAPRLHPVVVDHFRSSGFSYYVISALLYAALLLNAVVLADFGHPASSALILSIGLLAAWRWSWGAIHMVRGMLYRMWIFPRIRRQADLCAKPAQLLLLITSYRISHEVTDFVYDRLFAEIAAYGVPTTVVASVTDDDDIAVIRRCLARHAFPCEVEYLIQDGTGKRSAMYEALLALQRAQRHINAQVILMDGDTAMGLGALQKACSVVSLRGDVGAVTTENIPLVRGTVPSREWYRLRMAQRHNLMCSMSCSSKLLVLTGRFSVFRADLALSASFINAIADDRIEHWRLGEIKLLTGDDKSTWFETLKTGYSMLYVPDSVIHPIEELPGEGFFTPTVALMRRWYGNMLRNSSRALALGPRRCGLFLWLCLLDQRVSMWTTIVGPTSALTLTFLYGPKMLAAYAVWVLVSRGILALALAVTTGRFHPAFPLLLYYTQTMGSFVKIHTTFHLHRQKWNRQGISTGAGRVADMTSSIYYYGAIFMFLVLFGWFWTT
jgi:mannuronan synthase